jgi:CRISPR type III-B/RAMP module-associated protein Cmr5
MVLTLAQKRATFSFNKIKDILEKDYSSFLSSVPSTILKNGLLQTLSLYYSKKERDEKIKFLLEVIKDWLNENNNTNFTDVSSMILEISKADFKEYIKYQAEVLKLCEWMKVYGKTLKK